MKTLKSPFPYFGGKSKVAATVWELLGNVDNYIEPFLGSAAVLVARPHPPKIETGNDLDSMVANFWRATGKDPETVASFADNPVNEADMHARHRWLVLSDEGKKFRKRMRRDPDYFDAKIAGWWCWGQCCWIGAGWCQTNGLSEKLPDFGGDRGGLRDHRRNKRLPEPIPVLRGSAPGGVAGLGDQGRPHLADAFSRGRGVNGNDSAGTCEARRQWLTQWFLRLRDRLRTVRICCGDWLRVCDSDSVTSRLGLTGIFFDPPYGLKADRAKNLYAKDSDTVAEAVRKYCLERGGRKGLRIVLAGYAGEGHEELEENGWSVLKWKAPGGYNNRTEKGKENNEKERLWISPGCGKRKGFF